MKKKKALLFLLFTALTTGCSIGALTSNKSSAGTVTEKISDEGIHADIKDEKEDYVAEYSISSDKSVICQKKNIYTAYAVR